MTDAETKMRDALQKIVMQAEHDVEAYSPGYVNADWFANVRWYALVARKALEDGA